MSPSLIEKSVGALSVITSIKGACQKLKIRLPSLNDARAGALLGDLCLLVSFYNL